MLTSKPYEDSIRDRVKLVLEGMPVWGFDEMPELAPDEAETLLDADILVYGEPLPGPRRATA